MFESVIFKRQRQLGHAGTETDREWNPITVGTLDGRFPECTRTALENVYHFVSNKPATRIVGTILTLKSLN